MSEASNTGIIMTPVAHLAEQFRREALSLGVDIGPATMDQLESIFYNLASDSSRCGRQLIPLYPSFSEIVWNGNPHSLYDWWAKRFGSLFISEVTQVCGDIFEKAFASYWDGENNPWPWLKFGFAPNFKEQRRVLIGGLSHLPSPGEPGTTPEEARLWEEELYNRELVFSIDSYGIIRDLRDKIQTDNTAGIYHDLNEAAEAAWNSVCYFVYSNILDPVSNQNVFSYDGKPFYSSERGNFFDGLDLPNLNAALAYLRPDSQEELILLIPARFFPGNVSEWRFDDSETTPTFLEWCRKNNVTVISYPTEFGWTYHKIKDLDWHAKYAHEFSKRKPVTISNRWVLCKKNVFELSFLGNQRKPSLLLQTIDSSGVTFKIRYEFGGLLLGHDGVAGGKIVNSEFEKAGSMSNVFVYAHSPGVVTREVVAAPTESELAAEQAAATATNQIDKLYCKCGAGLTVSGEWTAKQREEFVYNFKRFHDPRSSIRKLDTSEHGLISKAEYDAIIGEGEDGDLAYEGEE